MSVRLPAPLAARYRPLRELGVGGVGRVVSARDRLLDEIVALKLLRRERGARGARIREEFSLLSTLDHPGIVRVRELGVADGLAYLVTDFIDGLRLDGFLAQEDDPETVVGVLAGMLNTLAWLHVQGILHGDIKPSNVLVVAGESAPRPIFIDFGLAQAVGGGRMRGGTPAFLAPELRADPALGPTPQSDLFALGACFASWLEEHATTGAGSPLIELLRSVVAQTSEREPARRPQSAARLAAVVRGALGRELGQPSLGGRGMQRLWGEAVGQLAREVVSHAGHFRVTLPAEDDAAPFLTALKAALERSGQAAILVPEGGLADAPLWDRLLACLSDASGRALPEDGDLPGVESVGVHGDPDLASIRILNRLRHAGPATCLLFPNPQALSPPDGRILARLIEGEAPLPIVLAHEDGATDRLEPWTVANSVLQGRSVPEPSARQITTYLRQCGIAEPMPDRVRRALVGRAKAGASVLRKTLDVWARAGVLVADRDQRWRWSDEVSFADIDAPDLDGLWCMLWDRLTELGRGLLRHLWWLGGQASRNVLHHLTRAESGQLDTVVEQLADQGWIRTDAWVVSLRPSIWARLEGGVPDLEHPNPSKRLRARYARILEDTAGIGRPRTRRAAERRAQHLVACGRHEAAAAAWTELGEELAERFDSEGAGRAFLSAAMASNAARARSPRLRRERARRVIALVERAAYWLEVAADLDGLEAALREGSGTLGATEDPLPALSMCTLELRLAIHRSDPNRALQLAERAEALLGEVVSGDSRNPTAEASPVLRDLGVRDRTLAARFEVALGRGTALVQKGEPRAAVRWLETASVLAERRSDRLATARLANNLGNVWFQQGEWEAAAEAYQRSAAAKQAAGDLRGLRIAESNRALVLRQSGRLVEAVDTAVSALSLARRIGDRRGEAGGLNALAVLWLDLGDAERAALSLQAFARFPVVSHMLRLDGALTRASLHLARLEWTEAFELAAAARAEAADIGVGALARDACSVAYLAQVGLAEQAPPGRAISLDDLCTELSEARREGHLAEVFPLSCAAAHAAALAGDWGLARRLLRDSLGRSAETVAPGSERGLALAGATARLMGDTATEEHLRHLAIAVVKQRMRAWRELRRPGREADPSVVGAPQPVSTVGHELEPPASRDVLRTLGLVDVVPLDALPPAASSSDEGGAQPTPAEGLRMPPDHAVTILARTLTGLGNARLTDPAAWARALRDVVGGSDATLWAFGDAGPTPVAASDRELEVAHGPGNRWREILVRLRQGGSPFLARDEQGRLLAAGLPLGYAAGQPPVGAVVLQWEAGAPAPDLVSSEGFARVLQLGAVVLERHELVRSNIGLRETVRLAEEREQALVADHRDQVTALREALQHTQTECELRFDYGSLVYRSRAMRRVLHVLDKVTEADVSVLLTGESGVGKELLARAIHYNGPRQSGPFVAENCGAVPGELFESTFFGHVRGSFTGADAARPGLLRGAHGGTLFLDEVGELRSEHQVKLLRALQERRIRPVGGRQEIEVDFRVVAATNRDLVAMVRSGEFREDLYYRLAVVTVEVPPVRARADDVLPLAAHFLERQEERLGRVLRLSPEAAEMLQRHCWPGNVREIENEILRASVLASGEVLEPRHLSPAVRGEPTGGPARLDTTVVGPPPDWPIWDGQAPLRQLVAELERRTIRAALARTGGRKAPAARLLGLSRPGLDSKLARLGITPVRRTAST